MKNRRAMRHMDGGITRNSIMSCMNVPRTIPELEWHIGSRSLPKDVTVRTAIKNMIADGIIERIEKRYSAYDAVEYILKVGE